MCGWLDWILSMWVCTPCSLNHLNKLFVIEWQPAKMAKPVYFEQVHESLYTIKALNEAPLYNESALKIGKLVLCSIMGALWWHKYFWRALLFWEILHPTRPIFETASSLTASSLTASSLTASYLTVVKWFIGTHNGSKDEGSSIYYCQYSHTHRLQTSQTSLERCQLRPNSMAPL